ncbi:MAG: hypothetical protein IT337_15230 [Thermomicrobiales bacterium]|nr:hypothetical protein [Thermomicrobiales bacterium]
MAEHIKIDDISPDVTYIVGASPQSVFSIPFPVFDDTDLIVTIDGTVMTLTTHYTVTGAGLTPPSAAAVTLVAAVANSTVEIARDVPIRRITDFPDSGPLQVPALNTELDRLVAIVQQIKDLADETPDLVEATLEQVNAALASIQAQVDPNAATVLFTTRGALAAAAPGVNVQYAVIRGYYAIGDLGAGLYKRLAAAPGSPDLWHVQTLNGVWFELLTEHGAIRPQQLGAKGDGANNDGPAIDAAFRNWATVRFPAGTYKKDNSFTIASGRVMELERDVAFAGAGVITNNGALGVPQPHTWVSTIPYPASFRVFGSDKVEFRALAASTGVDPVVERATADAGGAAQSKWFEYSLQFGNNRNPLLQLARAGFGGDNTKSENIGYFASEGEMFLGPGWRPDIALATNSALNMFRRKDHIRFNQRLWNGAQDPHQAMTWSQIGGAGASASIFLTGSTSPELLVETGATSGRGVRLDATYSPLFPGAAHSAHWFFRLGQSTNQYIEFGIASISAGTVDVNNRCYFSRLDTGSQGLWGINAVSGGAAQFFNSGMLTGTERIHFAISIIGTEITFWIGSVTGEFPPGQNVLIARKTFTGGFNSAVVHYPYFRFENSAAENKLCYHSWWYMNFL